MRGLRLPLCGSDRPAGRLAGPASRCRSARAGAWVRRRLKRRPSSVPTLAVSAGRRLMRGAERAPPESAGRRLTRRVRAADAPPDGALMRLCRSFRRHRVRPNRARLRRWVLQWCLLVACKPTHGRSQGKIQS